MKQTLLRSLALTGLMTLAAAFAAPKLYVAYPNAVAEVPFDHVLLEGSVNIGATLTLNGKPVNTAPDGLFIEWIPLQKGLNLLRLESIQGAEKTSTELKITSSPPIALPETPTQIVKDSVSPSSDALYYGANGQAVQISFQGAANGQASFRIGGKGPFPMLERKAENFPGTLDPETHKPLLTALVGRYESTYLLQPFETLDKAEIVVSLLGKDGQTVTSSAPGTISVVPSSQPRVGIYTGTPDPGISGSTEVARNGAGRSYILYPRAGTKFTITGEEGSTYQARIAPGQYVNLRKDKLRLLPLGAAAPRLYFTTLRTVRVPGATQVRFLLPDVAPYSLEQNAASSDQSLTLRLYGVESDVDYMVYANPDPMVKDIRWKQEQDGVFLAQIDLKPAQQWGYRVFYQDNTLVLELKDPPKISNAAPLKGHKIALDPGHGGEDNGAPGGLGVYEKEIVLAISKKVAAKLRAKGAEVMLTRETDVEVALPERSAMAQKAGAEVFVSIHTNAIPDGVDPNTVSGAGGYFFQPQSRALAQSILESISKTLPEVGNDGVHYQNLAVARPTQMPQVLIETAFMVNKSNLRILMSEAGQERFATAIAQGIENFYREAGRKPSR